VEDLVALDLWEAKKKDGHVLLGGRTAARQRRRRGGDNVRGQAPGSPRLCLDYTLAVRIQFRAGLGVSRLVVTKAGRLL
jgi:hypothetical protein